MATIGKNILENLTTGMYSDSLVIYREYVQNACDQIDKAVDAGLCTYDDASILITIDSGMRYIEIFDNATGVSKNDFVSQLGDIANSDKQIGKDKGFRGIGRLCGLAYCKTLKFITTSAGESEESTMIMDAAKMREMLVSKEKFSVDQVLDAIVSFEYHSDSNLKDLHYFKVQLIGVNPENRVLLNEDLVKSYLSFVAPVEYVNSFLFRGKIKEHAEELNYNIDEYRVFVNGWEIHKAYSTYFYDGAENQKKKYDEIFDVGFKDFYNQEQELVAWCWYGLSRFEKAIPVKLNPMYGFRIRQGNIQIGNNEVLSQLFRENRGNRYFVGEVFVVSPELIPNSQRDYFNENPTRIEFESLLRDFFYNDLHNLYYDANRVKNDYKKLQDFNSAVKKYEDTKKRGFSNDEERQTLEAEIKTKKIEKDKAKKRIEKKDYIDQDSSRLSPKEKVEKRIQEKFTKSGLLDKVKIYEQKEEKIDKGSSKKTDYFTEKLSKLKGKERMIIRRVLEIIKEETTPEESEKIKRRIVEEFK